MLLDPRPCDVHRFFGQLFFARCHLVVRGLLPAGRDPSAGRVRSVSRRHRVVPAVQAGPYLSPNHYELKLGVTVADAVANKSERSFRPRGWAKSSASTRGPTRLASVPRCAQDGEACAGPSRLAHPHVDANPSRLQVCLFHLPHTASRARRTNAPVSAPCLRSLPTQDCTLGGDVGVHRVTVAGTLGAVWLLRLPRTTPPPGGEKAL